MPTQNVVLCDGTGIDLSYVFPNTWYFQLTNDNTRIPTAKYVGDSPKAALRKWLTDNDIFTQSNDWLMAEMNITLLLNGIDKDGIAFRDTLRFADSYIDIKLFWISIMDFTWTVTVSDGINTEILNMSHGFDLKYVYDKWLTDTVKPAMPELWFVLKTKHHFDSVFKEVNQQYYTWLKNSSRQHGVNVNHAILIVL
jgi:hypothetical protein